MNRSWKILILGFFSMVVALRPPSIGLGIWFRNQDKLANRRGNRNQVPLTAEEEALILALKSEVQEIRNKSFSALRVPQLLLPAFAFRMRWLQGILTRGNTIKEGLIEEWGIHILAESLFLTITVTPIIARSLQVVEEDTIWQYVLYSLVYLTTLMQVVSIFSNIICFSAATEVPDEIFLKWLMSNNRLNSVVITGQLHTLSTWLFLVTVVYWPFVQNDSLHMKLLCGLSVLVPAIAYLFGPYQQLNRDLFPVVQHQVYTEDPGLQAAAENDMAMFFDYRLKPRPIEIAVVDAEGVQSGLGLGPPALAADSASIVVIDQAPLAEAVTVGSFLQDLGLGSFQAAFEANDIELDMIPEMSSDDFKALGLTISERVRLQRAYVGVGVTTRAAAV